MALIQRKETGAPSGSSDDATPLRRDPANAFDLSQLPASRWSKLLRRLADANRVTNPFFLVHDGRAGATTSIGGRTVVNFGSYDYLGLSGHPVIGDAAKTAIDRYGTSVSASRLIGGERPLHRELEMQLAELHGTEDALVFTSGHATNVTVIGHLLGERDVILCDSLIHNSIQEGARLSRATVLQFPHNDLDALKNLLADRGRYERALIVVEGMYSMEGDCCDLRRLVEIKADHACWLMVDEAHSIGVLGGTGRGIAEEQGVDPDTVEIWMGTLSKAFASTGGYIGASRELIDLLRTSAPGFVFSVGLAPAQTAAALAAIQVMRSEPGRLKRLRDNSRMFLEYARQRGLETGSAAGYPIVPVRVDDPVIAATLSNRLLARRFNVPPAIFPAVRHDQSRLRFFISAEHESYHLKEVIEATAEELALIASQGSLRSPSPMTAKP